MQAGKRAHACVQGKTPSWVTASTMHGSPAPHPIAGLACSPSSCRGATCLQAQNARRSCDMALAATATSGHANTHPASLLLSCTSDSSSPMTHDDESNTSLAVIHQCTQHRMITMKCAQVPPQGLCQQHTCSTHKQAQQQPCTPQWPCRSTWQRSTCRSTQPTTWPTWPLCSST